MSVLAPTPKRVLKTFSLAPRPDTIEGKTIALYCNNKPTGQIMLEVVEKCLLERGVKDFIKVSTPSFSRHPDSATDEAAKADGAVLAAAD